MCKNVHIIITHEDDVLENYQESYMNIAEDNKTRYDFIEREKTLMENMEETHDLIELPCLAFNLNNVCQSRMKQILNLIN